MKTTRLNAERIKRIPAVFLDRDGVLIRDVHLLTDRQQVHLFEGVPEAIMTLKASGFLTVVVSNQPVVARGLISEQEVKEINLWIQHLLQESRKVQCSRNRL